MSRRAAAFTLAEIARARRAVEESKEPVEIELQRGDVIIRLRRRADSGESVNKARARIDDAEEIVL